MTKTTGRGVKTTPVYMPEICARSAGAHIGQPWQPFSYVVRQKRGQSAGTRKKKL